MTTVLVTGASGFIGRYVVAALRRAGYEAVGLSRRAAAPPGLQVDLREPVDRLPVTDWVIHLAGGYAGAGRRALERTDRTIALNLLEWGSRAKVKRWIFASAAEVYGNCPGAVSEEAPTRPVIPYGAVKLEIERLFARAVREGAVGSAAVLRIGEVYGPDGNLINELSRRFRGGFCPWFGSGDIPVSFVHVEDVAAACVRMVEASPVGHAVWNVADDCPTTWRAFLDDFARLLGARRAVGLPDPLPRLYAAASGVRDRLRGRPPMVTRHIVALLTTPKAMSNRKLREVLGVPLAYPSYSQGLRASSIPEGVTEAQ